MRLSKAEIPHAITYLNYFLQGISYTGPYYDNEFFPYKESRPESQHDLKGLMIRTKAAWQPAEGVYSHELLAELDRENLHSHDTSTMPKDAPLLTIPLVHRLKRL